MDLKDFIKETIKAIVEATSELSAELSETGSIINPPTSVKNGGTFDHGDPFDKLRRVQNVEFDLALTSSSSTSGGGRGGMRIYVVEASADASHSRTSEEVSRVKFSIPVALPPSKEEATNRRAYDAHMQKMSGNR